MRTCSRDIPHTVPKTCSATDLARDRGARSDAPDAQAPKLPRQARNPNVSAFENEVALDTRFSREARDDKIGTSNAVPYNGVGVLDIKSAAIIAVNHARNSHKRQVYHLLFLFCLLVNSHVERTRGIQLFNHIWSETRKSDRSLQHCDGLAVHCE